MSQLENEINDLEETKRAILEQKRLLQEKKNSNV